jgi:hypothetical protein
MGRVERRGVKGSVRAERMAAESLCSSFHEAPIEIERERRVSNEK